MITSNAGFLPQFKKCGTTFRTKDIKNITLHNMCSYKIILAGADTYAEVH